MRNVPVLAAAKPEAPPADGGSWLGLAAESPEPSEEAAQPPVTRLVAAQPERRGNKISKPALERPPASAGPSPPASPLRQWPPPEPPAPPEPPVPPCGEVAATGTSSSSTARGWGWSAADLHGQPPGLEPPEWHEPPPVRQERAASSQRDEPPRTQEQRRNILEERRQDVLDEIARNDICFIEAATGMGKSTRIPQFVMDADPSHVVWQLQPRRLAAKRLAEYMSWVRYGSRSDGEDDVGFRVRGDQYRNPGTRLTYMTTGYFLHFVLHRLRGLRACTEHADDNVRQIRSGGGERWCTHLFVDEVHELSEETELVLLLVKMLAERAQLPFKVVILSATLDFDLFHSYFRPKVKDGKGDPPPPPPPARDGESSEEEEVVLPGQAGFTPVPVESFSLCVSEQATSVGLNLRPQSTGHGDLWEVTHVRQYSVASGRVVPGDLLVQINGRHVTEQRSEEVTSSLLLRPLELWFERRPPSTPARVADEVLNLSESTPYEVSVKYLDDLVESGMVDASMIANFNTLKHSRMGPEKPLVELCASIIMRECRPEDDVLVFLPGIAEIDMVQRVLSNVQHGRQVEVLHSITLAEHCEVPKAAGRPMVYLATSVAETSITLPELSVVFDFGITRTAVFDSTLEMEQLMTRLGNKTSARQRAGRVGRTKPGTVYRLYPKSLYNQMKQTDFNGNARCLESTILLTTKTLVPFLGMDVRECLDQLIQPPKATWANEAFQRLSELDALVEGENGLARLTVFGDFAVCLNVLGPRLARLVYCGIIYDCTRLAVALAAIHHVCNKGELWNIPPELRRGVKEEEAPPPTAPEQFPVTVGVDAQQLGLVFDPQLKQRWKITQVKSGSWAESQNVKVGDELFMVNGFFAAELDENNVVEEIRKRPVELQFLRPPDPSEMRDPAEDTAPLWSADTLTNFIEMAKYVVDMDRGYLSEPVMSLQLLNQFHERQVWKMKYVSYPRMKQVEGVIREVSMKLQSLLRGQLEDQPGVVSRLKEDTFFTGCEYGKQLPQRYLMSSFDSERLANLRLVLCAAFPGNFLFSSLNHPRLEQLTQAAQERKPEEEPPLALRRVPPSLATGDVEEAIRKTYGDSRISLKVEEQAGHPGVFALTPQAERKGLSGNIAPLAEPAVMNIVAMRDGPRRRLQLLFGDDDTVQACGELTVTPTYDWRLLRFPQLLVKPAPKMSALLNTGPVPGLGPMLPESGPSAEGVRLALAVDLEAVKLQQRRGKSFQGGKAIRSWLVAWLPSTDALDFTLLLVFWSKEMHLHGAPAKDAPGETVYTSITIGQGLKVTFDPEEPLSKAALLELQGLHLAIGTAHRTGSAPEASLPTLETLRAWGQRHLAKAKVSIEQPLAAPKGPGKGTHYAHRRGLGTVLLEPAPSHSLGVLGQALAEPPTEVVSDTEVAGEEPPPWHIECIVVPPRVRAGSDPPPPPPERPLDAPLEEPASQPPPPPPPEPKSSLLQWLEPGAP